MFRSILGALVWGEGVVLFQDLPVDTPKAGVDSDEQANNGDDAIEGAECQGRRVRSKGPVFAMAQGYRCSLSAVPFPRLYPRL